MAAAAGVTASAPAARRLPLVGLLLSALTTMVGSTVTMAAIPLAVLSLSSSSLALGAVGAAETAAAALGLVLSGPLADRVGARRLAVWSALAAAAVLVAVPAADASGHLHVWVLAAVGAGTALAAAPGLVCRQSLLGPTARAAHADEARVQSLYWLFPRLGVVIGAPAAAFLVTAAGPVPAVWADIGSYLVSALLIAAVPAPEGGAAKADGGGYLAELRAGLRAVALHRVIRAMAVLAFVLSAVDAPRISVIAPLYLRRAGAPGSALSWVVAAYTAGSLAGLLLHALLVRRLYVLPVLAGCFLGTAASYAALSAAHGTATAVACMTVMGLAQGPFLPVMVGVLTAHTEPAVQGRVLSTLLAVVSAALPLGDLVFGSLISAFPLPAVLLGTAALYALALWPTARVLGGGPGRDRAG